MALNAWRTMMMGALVFAGVALLGASCGGGPGTNDNCVRGGVQCPLGCAENLGCVSCDDAHACPPTGAPFCVLGRCEECSTTKDCGAGQACFPSDHNCRTACLSNANCPDQDEPICDLATGACVGCIPNMTQCPLERPICDPTRRRCSECASDADCGAAKPACNLQDGECEQCL